MSFLNWLNKPLRSKSATPVNPNTRNSWVVFVALVLLVNLPNMLPWEQTQYPNTYLTDLLERLLKCLLLAALYFSFFQRPWRAWLMLWLLCLWWMPISLVVRFVNFSPITSSLIGILLESTPREFIEFFLTLPWSFYVLFAALNGLFYAVYRWLKNRPHLIWPMKPRLALAVPGFALIVLFSGKTPAQPEPVFTKSSSAPVVSDLFSAEHISSVQEGDLPFAFPYELGSAYEQYVQAQRTVQGAIAQMQGHRQSIHPQPGASGPDVVVLVIGESSSRQDWQLFNSATVDTTPRLKARLLQDPGLLPFANVVAQSTATRYAVPGMLTNQPLYWPDGKPNPGATPSIIQMAQQAGYSTAWFSNQTSGGKFDGPIAIYAKEAQTVAFLNPSSFAYPGTYDEVLLPLLRRHLQTHTKAFVVLHTLGSHFQFAHRYPPEFERFKPALQKNLLNDTDVQNQKAVINAYHNSVLYTDHVLDEVIRTIETSGRPSVMVYASDHGQGLAEPACSQPAINRTMARAYEVPAMVWLSKEYRDQHPKEPTRLASHANLPYTTHAIYQTLVDLMEDKTQEDEHSSTTDPSFFTPPPSKSAQMVVSSSMRWLDFLVAAQRNRCLISAR